MLARRKVRRLDYLALPNLVFIGGDPPHGTVESFPSRFPNGNVMAKTGGVGILRLWLTLLPAARAARVLGE